MGGAKEMERSKRDLWNLTEAGSTGLSNGLNLGVWKREETRVIAFGQPRG